MKLHLSLLVILLIADACWSHDQCRMEDWWTSFDRQGWSRCGPHEYVTGFRRNYRTPSDPIYLLEEAKCCEAPGTNRHEPSTYKYANWWTALDKPRQWAVCPTGYFIKELYRSNGHGISNIEAARCGKPNTLTDEYNDCYVDGWIPFDRKGLSTCNDGYYLVGIYRGSCNKLYCIEQFKCCSMRAA